MTQNKFAPIIESLLDTDLYKFTMQQTVMHQFPHAHEVEYHFKCRTPGVNLVAHMDEINRQLDHLCTLRFKREELEYLQGLDYIKADYIAFLKIFQFDREYIKVVALNETDIDIVVRGPWLHVIGYEVPALAIVNEIYFRQTNSPDLMAQARSRLLQKIAQVREFNEAGFHFSDFGTRRRYSREWHEEVVQTLKRELPTNFTGTSNVLFAMKYNLTPIGTMAHEYLQACQALGPRLRDSQNFALEKWVQEYRGRLGIALTDVVGVDAFLRDFDLYFCKLFDGVRHDSGDAAQWTRKMLAHYSAMKIDARTKSLVYSDGLNFPKAMDLYREFGSQAKLFFGIGTNLTNDTGVKALNIVIKMTQCNGSPVAKVSDEPGKTMCRDEKYLAYLREVFDIR